MNRLKILCILLIVSCIASAQTGESKPVFSLTQTEHDFGTIGETDGYAEHTFRFKNTGNAPLVITRVQASCGCTRPEWTKAPVEPGKEGYILVAYNPKGRIGNFRKSITAYTNEEEGGFKRHKLYIKGLVTKKPGDPKVSYIDTAGGVGIEYKKLTFPNTTIKKGIFIKNYNNETAYFSWDKVPEYMKIKYPDSLQADWPGEILLSIDKNKAAEKRGRITDVLLLTIKNNKGKVLGKEEITTTANYVDDFSQLSPLQRAGTARLEIKNTKLEFGQVKKGFLGIGGSSDKELTLTNNGKSDLILHSVSSDDKRVHLPFLDGKILKIGEALDVKVTIKAKDLSEKDINTDIYIVCNDLKGPVRLVKVTAQKAK